MEGNALYKHKTWSVALNGCKIRLVNKTKKKKSSDALISDVGEG